MKLLLFLILLTISFSGSAAEQKNVYFGDTHLHTSYSFDAFLNNNHSADPDTAYRWAKGQPVIHPYNRTRVQIRTPLDFLVVSDHAEMLGVMRAVHEGTFVDEDLGWYGNIKRRLTFWQMNKAIDSGTGLQFFRQFLPQNPILEGHVDPVQHPANNISDLAIFGDTTKTSELAWHDIVETADRHNDPGNFTALLGWEWSSIPMGVNLHRIVVSPDGAEKGKQFLPFGSDISQYPEDLWNWLDETEQRTGARFIAIPHNSNISKGYMFDDTSLKGELITADYSRRRMKWEPIVEVTQIKGDSETRSEFSPNDEFADFENYDFHIQVGGSPYEAKEADFVRPALKKGLSIKSRVGVNPYKFGLIGSTDSHSGLASAEEKNFMGKMATDSVPENKTRLGSGLGSNGWNMSASGIAAVWATENTRQSIFDAFKRKEVYATSGPLIRLQVFAGWDFPENAEISENFSEVGSSFGVPMGADLIAPRAQNTPPSFLIRAVKDPLDANLDRLQVVKGWIDGSGKERERVFNVAWSDNRRIDSEGNLPGVGSTVDLASGDYTNTIGQSEFSVKWVDPEFNAKHEAFYYVRVLQIPTARNGLFDSLALQLDTPPRGPKTIQERAYSSPIWYQP